MNKNNFSQVLKSLTIDGIISMPKIEWWLLKYHDDYKKIKEEDSKHFMHLIDGKWVRLPDYFDARTPKEKFLEIYDALIEISEFHRNEDYFRNEIAIYKRIENHTKKLIKWLTKNEEIYLNEYYMFSMDYFGDEDEMENEINLKLKLSNGNPIYVDRNDFINTLMFTHLCNKFYWELIDKLNVDKLNT